MSEFYTACYSDVACASDIPLEDVTFDLETVKGRLAKEGVSFYTKTLPLLGKQLDYVLALPSTSDVLEPFPGWKKQSLSKVPRFMGALFNKVLAPDGLVRNDADPNALGRLRQLLYLFYKVEFPSTDKQNQEVLEKFVQTEDGLPEPDESIFDESQSGPFGYASRVSWILQRARALVHRILGNVDPLGGDEGIMPRHGPGAVATGEQSYEKPLFKRYYEQLHAVFPYDLFMSYNLSSTADEWQGWQNLESLRESTAKVVLVPKDSRGPRIISCEPLEVQWIQQALMTRLVNHLEAHPLTRGHVNFKRQEINRELALSSSTGLAQNAALCEESGNKLGMWSWITLDMKDASDRVSLALVRYLFPSNWTRVLESARSQRTKLPDGRLVNLKKFAPMGSATCFPVEALVFYSICVATQQYVTKSSGFAQKAGPNWPYVYGDDLIVSSHLYDCLEEALSAVHLKLNLTKCCRGDFFRESCGMDAFKGVDVTPLKIRRPLGHRSRTTLFSWCEYHNRLSRRGYENAARWIRQYLTPSRDALFIPVMDEVWLEGRNPGYAYLHVAGERPHALRGPLRSRFNSEFHRREFLGWGVRSCVRTHHLPGWSEMLRRASQKGLQNSGSAIEAEDRPLPSPFKRVVEAKAYEYTLAHGVVRQCAWYPALVG